MASIDKRPNGRYRARWREYPGGPQKTRSFARKVDAQRFLVDIEHRQLSGTYVAPEAARVVLDDYIDLYVARQPWRAATADAARKVFVHVRAALGANPMGTIRKSDVQAFISGLSRDTDKRKTLAPGYVALVFQHLNAVLESAADDGLIARNPARGVKLPGKTAGEVVPPTLDEVTALYEASPAWFRPAVVLGAGLGLRQAEASGLTADRVDWLRRVVRVDRQWMTRAETPAFAPPKTRGSDRTIPASGFVLAELGAHVGQRHEGFVLHRDRKPVDHQVFGYFWRQARKRAGVQHIRYHDLRHAFASMLISAGCSVKAVSQALGHSTAATTLNLYAHLWPGDEDRIRQAIDKALSPTAEDSLRIAEGGN